MEDDPKDNGKTQGLSDDDAALWAQVVSDVTPLSGRRDVISRLGVSPPKISPKRIIPGTPEQPPRQAMFMGRDIDRNTARRLKRGEMDIEGRIDLHGMNQGQARQALIGFIRGAEQAGKRCVLVITGKGNSRRNAEGWLETTPGVLKRNVPDWLYESELQGIVLNAVPARPKDGGDGALYVYLRRRRD